MALTLETLDQARVKAARRQRAGVVNRRLGWLILPAVIAAITLHYLPGGHAGGFNEAVKILQLVFVPVMLVHVALSVYVFGFVPPARTLRVFHVWFGYAYLILVLAAQTTFQVEPLHAILSVAMFTCLSVHVGIGVFYAVRRRGARVALRDVT